MSGNPERERQPFMSRLGWRRRRVPLVRQVELTECGAACLAMVLGYWGRPTSLVEVRRVLGSSPDGVDLHALLQSSESFGLRGRVITLEVGDIHHLPIAALLHWNFGHFVVYERCRRHEVHIVDPASGRRRVPTEQFRKSFTGVALILEPAASFESGPPLPGSRLRFARELWPERGLIGRVLVLSLVHGSLAMCLPLSTAIVVDRVVPAGDVDLLGLVAMGLLALAVSVFFSALARSHSQLALRAKLDMRLTLGLLERLVSLPYSYFQRHSSTHLALRVSSNVRMRELLTAGTLSCLFDAVLTLGYLAVASLISPHMALFAFCIGAARALVFAFARRSLPEAMSRDLDARTCAQTFLGQVVTGIGTLKFAGAEQRMVNHWSNLFAEQQNASLAQGRISAFEEACGTAISTAAPLALLTLGAMQVLNGSLSLGNMLAVVALAGGFLATLRTVIDSVFSLATQSTSLYRLDDVWCAEPEQRPLAPCTPMELTGRLELRGVCFRYAAQSPLVLEDVSFSVQPGELLAIVGRSGSGKSTLLEVLIGLLAPEAGQVLYDGKDLTVLDRSALRRRLGVVPRAPFVFAGTIRDNIALVDPDASDERILAAARLACLHDDISALPLGYATTISDDGATLSGGQRQRLFLARALLDGPRILVLDEATSSLDALTERAVLASLAELRCTRIVVTHRLSTAMDADRILVFGEGRILEEGTHAELLKRRGPYWSLAGAQFQQ